LASAPISLDTHIDDVLGLIRCGGMVISGVTEKIVHKIRSLVFVDAFVPEDGQCHMDLFPREYVQLMRLDAQQNGEGYKLTPPPPERVNLNAGDVEWQEPC
jgi:hypothetical protein